ncbi:hypothetical protein AAG906_035795 [Vitis piasezkii]
MKTLRSSSIKLDKDEKGKSIDSTMYRGMIGERQPPPGLKASALLSYHNRISSRLAERRGTTLLSSVLSKTVRGDIWTDGMATSGDYFGAHLPDSVCSILLPRGGHRDEVSYLEAFIVDSILIGRRIHVGYLMMMHMISCCESKTRVLPYGRFLTKAFKDAGVDLSRETDFEAPTTYDMYDKQSLGWMKFEKAPDGSWRLEFDIPHPLQTESVQFEASFPEPMISKPAYTAGPSFTEPSFTEPPHPEIPSQAPHAPDHAPWMDLSAQISSLGTRMEELAVVSDTRFYSMEDRIDQYQTGFTT